MPTEAIYFPKTPDIKLNFRVFLSSGSVLHALFDNCIFPIVVKDNNQELGNKSAFFLPTMALECCGIEWKSSLQCFCCPLVWASSCCCLQIILLLPLFLLIVSEGNMMLYYELNREYTVFLIHVHVCVDDDDDDDGDMINKKAGMKW